MDYCKSSNSSPFGFYWSLILLGRLRLPMCCSTLVFLCNSGQKIIFLYTCSISHKGSRPQICFFTSPKILLLFSKLRHQSHVLYAASSEQDHTRLSAIHKTRPLHYVCHFPLYISAFIEFFLPLIQKGCSTVW